MGTVLVREPRRRYTTAGSGRQGSPVGPVEGGTWTYVDESRMGGQLVKSRYVMRPSGPDAYDFRWEVLGADGKWSAVSEGRATRVKGK